MGSAKPLYSFTSHIDGKNAKVEIWPDRIEWERKAVSGGKVALGLITLGASTLVTGVRGKNTDMIPIRSVSAITSKKGLGLNTVVIVATAAGAVEFRTSHKEAEQVKTLVQRLMLEASAPQVVVQQAAPEPTPATLTPAAPDPTAQLQQLKGLLDADVLTQAEYDAKKAEILARM